MLVNILQTFDDNSGRRRFVGENPDVDPQIARQWIADGKAAADLDGQQASPYLVSGAGKVPQTVILFGDSITCNNNINNGTPTPATDQGRMQDTGWFSWMNIRAGSPLTVVTNAGIPGNTTQQMRDRLATDVLALPSGYVTLMGGTNDISTAVPLQTTLDNLKAMADAIRAAGRTLLFATPPGNIIFAANQTQREKLSAICAFVRAYCANNSQAVFLDAYTPVIDPASATGSPAPFGATANMTDNTHLGVRGAQLIAEYNQQAFSDAVIRQVPAASSAGDVVSVSNPNGNWFPSPQMTGTGGTELANLPNLSHLGIKPPNNFQRRITGTLAAASSLTGSRPALGTLPDVTYWAETIDIPSQAAIVNPVLSSTAAALPAGVSVGDVVEFSVGVEWLPDPAKLMGPWRVVLQFLSAGSAETGAIGLEYIQGATSPQRAFAGVVRAKGVVPAGTTQWRLYVEGRNLPNTAAAGTIRLFAPDARKPVVI